MNKSVKDRIVSGVTINENGCWIWNKSNGLDDYGRLSVNGVREKVHRLVYREFKGPLIDGMYVCHKCDTPACCNPDHLFQGTPKDNAQDCIKKGRDKNRVDACKEMGKQYGFDNGKLTAKKNSLKYYGRTELTKELIDKIKIRLSEGVMIKEIESEFNISRGQLYWLRKGVTYKELI